MKYKYPAVLKVNTGTGAATPELQTFGPYNACGEMSSLSTHAEDSSWPGKNHSEVAPPC